MGREPFPVKLKGSGVFSLVLLGCIMVVTSFASERLLVRQKRLPRPHTLSIRVSTTVEQLIRNMYGSKDSGFSDSIIVLDMAAFGQIDLSSVDLKRQATTLGSIRSNWPERQFVI